MTHFKKFTLEIPWYPFGCPSVKKRSKTEAKEGMKEWRKEWRKEGRKGKNEGRKEGMKERMKEERKERKEWRKEGRKGKNEGKNEGRKVKNEGMKAKKRKKAKRGTQMDTREFLGILFFKMRHAPIWARYLLLLCSPPTIFDPMQAGGFSLGHNGPKRAWYGGGSASQLRRFCP